MSQTYFASVAPGLEAALVEELRELGARKVKKTKGGAEFESTYSKVYKIVAQSRCASRILLRVDEFRARDRHELYNKTKRIDWARWFNHDADVEVVASSQVSKLIHTGLITETVSKGIAESRGVEGRDDRHRVYARLDDDRCTLSIDTSGPLLHQRGWKEHAVAAPIRETTAAALLRLSGWKGGAVLDPTCGSGTFVIEAAQRAAGIPPSATRTFSIQRWANFDAGQWAKAIDVERIVPEATFAGSDQNPKAIEASRENSKLAGVDAYCSFEVLDAKQIKKTADTGLIIFNPPYGKRVAGASLTHEIIKHVKAEFSGWTCCFVVPATFGPRPEGFGRFAKFSHGGIAVNAWLGRIE